MQCEPINELKRHEEQPELKEEGVEVTATGETLIRGKFPAGVDTQVIEDEGADKAQNQKLILAEACQTQPEELRKLKSNRAALESHSKLLESEKAKLEVALAESKDDAKKLQSERDEIASNCAKLKSNRTALESHSKLLESEKAKLEVALAQSKDDAKKLQSERDEIASKCAELKSDRAALESHLKLLESEKAKLEVALAESKDDAKKLQSERDELASDCETWEHHAKSYYMEARELKSDLLKSEKEQKKVERELVVANAELKDKWVSSRKDSQGRTRKQQEEIVSLKAELEKTKLTEQRIRKQLAKAEEVAAEASTTSSNLFQMLQMDVVKRNSAGRSTEFPNGDEIEAMFRRFQDDVDDYLRDLADLVELDVLFADSQGTDVYECILDNVLVPAANAAFRRASKFVEDKRASLLALVGDDKLPTTNKLVDILWTSSMQARTTEMIASSKNTDVTEQDLVQQDEERNTVLLWALQPHICNHDGMEGRHIGSFIRSLFQLVLMCQFSSPPCYLHPYVGDVVAYNPTHHVVTHMPNRRKRVSPGRKVRVIAPGLYFAPPETKERNKPIPPKVEAVVVMF